MRVKHLNPRQGITTDFQAAYPVMTRCVKHLNPRQGITTYAALRCSEARNVKCETPKSPPGDYNSSIFVSCLYHHRFFQCETPKSPPGDYNPRHSDSSNTALPSTV